MREELRKDFFQVCEKENLENNLLSIFSIYLTKRNILRVKTSDKLDIVKLAIYLSAAIGADIKGLEEIFMDEETHQNTILVLSSFTRFSIYKAKAIFSIPEFREIFIFYYSYFGQRNLKEKESLLKCKEIIHEAVFNILRTYYLDQQEK